MEHTVAASSTGGRSTGPKTEEGKARISAASLKHGRFTNEAIAKRKALSKELKALKSRTERLKPTD